MKNYLLILLFVCSPLFAQTPSDVRAKNVYATKSIYSTDSVVCPVYILKKGTVLPTIISSRTAFAQRNDSVFIWQNGVWSYLATSSMVVLKQNLTDTTTYDATKNDVALERNARNDSILALRNLANSKTIYANNGVRKVGDTIKLDDGNNVATENIIINSGNNYIGLYTNKSEVNINDYISLSTTSTNKNTILTVDSDALYIEATGKINQTNYTFDTTGLYHDSPFDTSLLTPLHFVDKSYVDLKNTSLEQQAILIKDSNIYATQTALADTVIAHTTGLLDDRGNYDASVNTFPTTGGSGTAGAIMRGDWWHITVKGAVDGDSLRVGSSIAALIDAPGQTNANWNILNAGSTQPIARVAGDIGVGYLKYNGISKASGQLDGGTTNPSHASRLNYDGYFYATNLYSSSYIGTKTLQATNTGSGGTSGYFITRSGNAIVAALYQSPNANNANDLVQLSRITNSSTYDITGNIISITDNPTTSGSTSGKVLTAIIGTKERISFNPRGMNNNYLFDTYRNLADTSTIFAIKDSGVYKIKIKSTGEIYTSTDTVAHLSDVRNPGSISEIDPLSVHKIDTVNRNPGSYITPTQAANIYLPKADTNHFMNEDDTLNYKLITYTQNYYNVSDTVSTDMTNVYVVTFSKAYREHRIDTLSGNATVTINKSALAKPGAIEVFYSRGTGASKTINFGSCKNSCLYEYDDTASRMNVIIFKLCTGGIIERCVYQRY
jgi:hypothetical protein